jgi:hypothetical protein
MALAKTFIMIFCRCDVVWKKIAHLSINSTQQDTFVPNFVQIGRQRQLRNVGTRKKESWQKNTNEFFKGIFTKKKKQYKNHHFVHLVLVKTPWNR